MHFSGIGLLLVAYGALAWHFSPHMGDDGFIFYRYAANMAAGHGPVWNPGQLPVEGYSSPLWLFCIALPSAFGLAPHLVGSVLGLAFGMLSIASFFQLLLILGRSPRASWLAVGAGLTVGLHYWSPAGLETALYLFLWIWSLIALDKPKAIWSVALLGIVRPEGPFLVVCWCLADAVLSRRMQWLRWVILCSPAVLWFVFRWIYYGDWLPNTYYAKVGGDLFERLYVGIEYAMIPCLVWGLAVVGAFFRRDRFSLVLLTMIGIQLLVVVGGGGDWMFWGRMLLPAVIVLWAFVYWETQLDKILAAGMVFCLAQFWPPLGVFSAISRGEQMPVIANQEGSLIDSSRELASHIRSVSPKGSLIAVNHAGALPYFLPEYRFIDMTGLNDNHISRLSGGLHQKYDPDYVLSLRPDGVVLNTRTRPSDGNVSLNYWAGETALARHPEFQSNYRPLMFGGSDKEPDLYLSRVARGGTAAYIVYFVRITP